MDDAEGVGAAFSAVSTSIGCADDLVAGERFRFTSLTSPAP